MSDPYSGSPIDQLVAYYDELQVAEALKKEIKRLSERYGAGFLADLAGVDETTIHSWQAPSGKLPGVCRFIYFVARLSQKKNNDLIANLMLWCLYRVTRVDEFKSPNVNRSLQDELFKLFVLVARLADLYGTDPEAGLLLMDTYDRIGRDMRAEFEEQKAARRTAPVADVFSE